MGAGRQHHHDPPGGPTARAPAVGPEAVRQSWMRPWGNLAEWSVTVNDLRVRVGQVGRGARHYPGARQEAGH